VDKLGSDCQCCRQGFDAKRAPAKRRCCAQGACCRKVLASATISYVHGILRAALQDAVREDRLGRNVAKLVAPPPIRSERIEPWTAEEAKAFLGYARGRERFAAVFELVLRTGLRIGEVLALSWDDVDLTSGTIRVRRSVRRHLNGKGLVLSEPKTSASRRRIPLPPGCAVLFTGQRARQRRDKAASRGGWVETGLVFTTLLGTTLDPVHVSAAFRTACIRSGVRRIRFHDLCHTCATLMLESGADLVTVKELLGHSKIQITADVYTHVRLRVTRTALDAMADMLGEETADPDQDTKEGDLPNTGD
jgi:integrase